MEERRRARVGTVGGLAVLVGGTAVAAVAGGSHSAFSSAALGILALALGHSLLDEIRRQAGRRSADCWTAPDTVNASVLAAGAAVMIVTTLLDGPSVPLRVVTGVLGLGYAVSGGYFVALRRRTLRAAAPARPAPMITVDGPS